MPSNWLSLVSTAIAVVALALSFRSQRMAREQFRTAQLGTAHQRMTALIQELVKAVGRAGVSQPQPGVAPTAETSAALVELEATANALGDFLEHEDNRTLNPGWLALCALAWAFANSWNISRAEHYWARAVQEVDPAAVAGTTPASDRAPDTRAVSYVRVLRAQFLYAVDRPGDVDRARDDFEAARSAIDADDSNTAPSVHQKIMLLVGQAQCELVCGHTRQTVERIGDAVALTQDLGSAWRRRQAEHAIATFVLNNAQVVHPEAYQLSQEVSALCAQMWQFSQQPPPSTPMPARPQPMAPAAGAPGAGRGGGGSWIPPTSPYGSGT